MTRLRSRLAAALAAAAGLALLAAAPVFAQSATRSLHWSLFEVDARIDAEGALHVVERQHMVFTGDWNGGERTFRLGPGQTLRDFSIVRIDPETEARLVMRGGDLNEVDHWDRASSNTFRWRSRMPSDPPFDGDTLVYELRYELTGVLRPRGQGVYALDHEFAFTDRTGTIERLTVDLELDPAFQPVTPLPTPIELENVPPNRRTTVHADLRYVGDGRPAAAITPGAGPGVKLFVLLLSAVGVGWMLWRFHREELAVGRAPGRVRQPAEVDRGWIESELLPIRPEVVGALWDRRVRAPEVSALIARLVGEGRLESTIESGEDDKEEMRLRKVAPAGSFEGGYEADLVSKLFFEGREEVTTSDLKAHYKKKGFDPTGVIKAKLETRVERDVPGAAGKRAGWSFKPALGLLLALVACFVVEAITRPAGLPALVLPLMALGPVLWMLGLVIAGTTRRKVEHLRWVTLGLTIPFAALVVGATLFGLLPGPGPIPLGLFGVLALGVAPLFVARTVLHLARIPEPPEAIEARKRLLFARRYFEDELAKPHPDLSDAWFPYLLAFGLSHALDRWAKSFGDEVDTLSPSYVSGSSSWTGGGSSASWTGGGGQFGGAGASGAWAVAATGLAAGVSPPSSGGSGGGGGGGGGSFSGGGGGGGW